MQDKQYWADLVLEDLDTLVCCYRPNGEMVYINRAYREFYGVNADEVPGRNLFESLNESVASKLMRAVSEMTPESPTYEHEHYYRLKVRSPSHWQRWTEHGVFDENGQLKVIYGLGVDITQQREREIAVAISEGVFQQVFENCPVPLWREDFSVVYETLNRLKEEGVSDFRRYFDEYPEKVKELLQTIRITDVNRATVELQKATSKEDLMVNLDKIFHEDVLRIFKEELVAIAEGREYFQSEAPVFTLDGGRVPTLLFMYIPQETQEFSDILVSSIDISQLKEAERALVEARHQAEEASRAKSSFLSTVSHEIRTPLNGIVGFLQLLEETPLSEDQREYSGVIAECSETLLELINQVLDLAKIEASEMVLEKRNLNLKEISASVVAVQNVFAEKKGISLTFEYAPELPENIIGDDLRIKQVIINLISNAIKFTAAGGVFLNIGKAGENVAIEVRDTGIGMDEEASRRVLQPFVQADSSTTRKFGGTGLGLSICYSLAQLMGGELSLKSKVGEGTTITFTFPLEVGEEEVESKAKFKWNISSEARDIKVLLAEDNKINQRLMKFIFDRLNVDVTYASNGRKTLDALTAEAYDLLLLDVQMPDMDGIEVARRVRSGECGEASKTIAIAAITAHVLSDVRQTALDAGMDTFLTKPVRFNDIAELLEKVAAEQPGIASP